ncbi:dihydrofolate reductase family protein [Arthrobacter sp. PsM3]|uniref:dihydrofolate reductase family protein n=1 Tax=Arthrobacter sp. PsM3 TaxID=3030531 RepID=UPI003F883255
MVTTAYFWSADAMAARLVRAGLEVVAVQTRTDPGRRPQTAMIARRSPSTSAGRLADATRGSFLSPPHDAGSKYVADAGGASTVRQHLPAGLIDELRLHIAPIVLGAGERLLDGVANLKLEPTEVSGTRLVTHVRCRIIH